MSNSRRIRRRIQRALKGPETEPRPKQHDAVEEVSKTLTSEALRVWSQSKQGSEALTEYGDRLSGLPRLETKHQAPMGPFRDIDGTTKRLFVAATYDHQTSSEPRPTSVEVKLQQYDSLAQNFRDLVVARSSDEDASIVLGEYGARLHPDMDYLGASEIMARGIDRAEVEQHRRRPSILNIA